MGPSHTAPLEPLPPYLTWAPPWTQGGPGPLGLHAGLGFPSLPGACERLLRFQRHSSLRSFALPRTPPTCLSSRAMASASSTQQPPTKAPPPPQTTQAKAPPRHLQHPPSSAASNTSTATARRLPLDLGSLQAEVRHASSLDYDARSAASLRSGEDTRTLAPGMSMRSSPHAAALGTRAGTAPKQPDGGWDPPPPRQLLPKRLPCPARSPRPRAPRE